MRKARPAVFGAAALAFAGSLALTAPAAQAGTSEAAAAKAASTTALAICPVKVSRSTQRWHLQKKGVFAPHDYFKKGALLNIYQGETRRNGKIVVVKTTTVVGKIRYWVNQAHITGTGGACRS
ncbi:hypothetical protein [Nonomuraea antimicrobica]